MEAKKIIMAIQGKGKRIVISLTLSIVFAANGIAGIDASGAISIVLEKKMFSNSGPLYGMTNIFFEETGMAGIQKPAGWKDIRLAKIIETKGLKSVIALQYKDESETDRITVDTNADGNWSDETPLVFEKIGDSSFADFTVRFVPADGNNPPITVAYQIIRSGSYSYARIREYRSGTFKIEDVSFSVLLRPDSRDAPFYGLDKTLFFIDLDGNGEINQYWKQRDTGALIPSEQVSLKQPFILSGRRFVAESLDFAGIRLILKPTSVDIGVSPGFIAPPLEARDLEGRTYRLQDLKGRVVLLEFWSVNCPWGDSVRPLINELAEKFKGPAFAVFSIARENEPLVLREYLKTKPKSTIVLGRDDKAWTTYNPEGITPLCFLLDHSGVIRLIAPGATSQKALKSAIEGLITAH